MPAAMKPPSSVVQLECTVTPCMSSSASATSPSPALIDTRGGSLVDSRPATGATKKETTVSGRKRRPVCTGE